MKILYHTGRQLTRLISRFVFRIKITGADNVPSSGPFILATNHISYYDPPLVGSWIRREVYFMAKQELFRNRLFGWAISRTNALPMRRGTIDRKGLELCLRVLENGEALTIFPEGTRSLRDGFLDPKPGLGLVARKALCPIVPGYVHGANKPGDCFWGRDRMSINYGPPIQPEEYESFPADKTGYQAIAELAMDRIGQLKQERLDLKF